MRKKINNKHRYKRLLRNILILNSSFKTKKVKNLFNNNFHKLWFKIIYPFRKVNRNIFVNKSSISLKGVFFFLNRLNLLQLNLFNKTEKFLNCIKTINNLKNTFLTETIHNPLGFNDNLFLNLIGLNENLIKIQILDFFKYTWSFKKLVKFLNHKLILWKIINLYNTINNDVIQKLYIQYNSLKNSITLPIYHIYWTFKLHQNFYINMRNCSSKYYNYLSLYSGLFLKFYNNKKPLRKSKLLKILMIKLLRKILLLTNIKIINIIINNASANFVEFYKLLNTPSIIPYFIPNSTTLYNDIIVNFNKDKKSLFDIKKLIFRRTLAFAPVKLPRKGRLKRKITRRIVKKNNIMD